MIDRAINSRGFDNFDFRFIGLIFAILGVGVLSIYSVTHDQGVAFPFYAKQLVWIVLGTVAFLVMWLSDYHRIARLAYPAYDYLNLISRRCLKARAVEGATLDSDRPFASAIGICEARPHSDLAHYYSKAQRVGWLQRWCPGAVGVAGVAPDPEARISGAG
jgi:rod shape determining protein RodA